MSERAPVAKRARAAVVRHGWLIAIAVTYCYLFPYYPKLRSANELPRVYLVKAIVHDRSFAIDSGVARWGATADVSPANGHQYSNKAPGSSLWVAPPYAVISAIVGEPELATTMWIARMFGGILPALWFLARLYRFLARWVPDQTIRQLVCLGYGLGSLAMTYSMLFYSHQLAAICVGAAWMIGLDAADPVRPRTDPTTAPTPRLRAMVIAGGLAGCAPLADYQAAFAIVPVAIHLLVVLARRYSLVAVVEAVAVALLGMAVPIAILLGYHAICFGSPWRTGYDASTTFAHFHQAGFLGMTALRWEAFIGSTVRLDNGLFALAPWLALAVPGSVVLVRGWHAPGGERLPATRSALIRGRIEIALGALAIAIAALAPFGALVSVVLTILGGALAAAGVAHQFTPAPRGDLATALVGATMIAIYILFVSSLNFWRGGWGVGPRYVTAMVPFMLPAVAVALAALARRARFALAVCCGLVVAAIAIYTLSAMTLPYWPDSVAHPLYDVILPLWLEGRVAPNLASWLGVPGLLGVIPVIFAVLAATGYTIYRLVGARGLVIAFAVAAAIIGGYGLKQHGDRNSEQVLARVRAIVS